MRDVESSSSDVRSCGHAATICRSWATDVIEGLKVAIKEGGGLSTNHER